ncbi:MAG: rhodanese-like domain-containing protein [Prolixibacteraceae bacterium]|jgi:rhodanese-related sulfurtransferase
MISTLRNLFGLGPKVEFAELVAQGAVIIDVRTKGEYEGGHIKGSINISLDQLGKNIHKLKSKNKPIITCCESGARSSSAKSILKSNGFTEVYNGGSWRSLQSKI